MWALIAFIVLGIVVATLIEVNERIKAKKSKVERKETKECLQEKADSEACAGCGLAEACEKKPTVEP